MKPSSELIDLVAKSYGQCLSQPEADRLQELLQEEEAMAYYLEMAEQDAGLTALVKEGFMQPENVIPFIQKFAGPLIGAAAVVMFILGYISGNTEQSAEGQEQLVVTDEPAKQGAQLAWITSMVGVSWEGEPTSLQLGANSAPIKFSSGLVEVTFDSGVKMLVEGPAELRITGGNSAYLDEGRLVADVPKGAEGFTVDYAQGKLVDLGTEFAMQVNDHDPVEVGVFRGEVEVYTSEGATPVKVVENHAVQHAASMGDSVMSVPFKREKYVRAIPSSEFAWAFPAGREKERVTVEFDVSHLVWKAGGYHAVVKWMHGRDGVRIHGTELFCDGVSVATDVHEGATGIRAFAHDNVYVLEVKEEAVKRGKWSLRVQLSLITPEGELPDDFSADSAGLVLFEEVSKIRASEKDFLGKWEYFHDGHVHQRVFHADHTASYYYDGELRNDFDGATWKVVDNVLVLTLPPIENTRPNPVIERHLMRNRQELIFESLPYRNGKKVN